MKNRNAPGKGAFLFSSLKSLNMNAGIGARYYVSADVIIGINLRYNFLFYKNPGGTDLSGNAWTLGITIGGANGLKSLRRGKN